MSGRFRDLEQALARLETRVDQLERRELATRRRCEVCSASGDHNVPSEANCFLCCRDLCDAHLRARVCPHHATGQHEPRSPDGSRKR